MRRPAIALLVVLPFLAFLASCGTSDGDATPPTSAELVEVLPTAAQVGADYEVSDEDLSDKAEDDEDEESSDEPDETDQALYDACPGAEVLEDLDTGKGNPDEVSREFTTESEKTIEVSLDPTPAQFTEEKVDQVVKALADCKTIKTTDDEGTEIEMTIKAERSDEFGDFGLKMSMQASFELMGMPLELEFRGAIFSVDGVAVSVIATSGLDDETFELIEGDYDQVQELAGSIEEQIAAL